MVENDTKNIWSDKPWATGDGIAIAIRDDSFLIEHDLIENGCFEVWGVKEPSGEVITGTIVYPHRPDLEVWAMELRHSGHPEARQRSQRAVLREALRRQSVCTTRNTVH